ncbi:hypothetical protein Tsubulata_026169 [Turnera subulata]|uniref:1-phosphatidylinositol-3-phosphate 5-kinase n=1 Tax=Turnera subulata TaxID=218843 RepID=A0A9Q0GD97_9ROSI|nr:hypothetical protein Tsubulata_026169 [Turnera subulata]
MGTSDNKISDLVDIVRSWIPRRGEPANVSRDFWMPDQSCRVCYDCDSQFTVFNRRHHCRLCGRVFCAKCTANSVPAPSDEPRANCEDWIRVCNYCFKQWKQGVAAGAGAGAGAGAVDNGTNVASPGLSPSPSATSLASTQSTCTCNSSSTAGSIPYSTGSYQRVPHSAALTSQPSIQMDTAATGKDDVTSARSNDPSVAVFSSSPNQFGYPMSRSDDEDDDFGVYRSVSEASHFSHADGYASIDGNEYLYGPYPVLHSGDHMGARSISCSPSEDKSDARDVERIKSLGGEADEHDAHESVASPYDVDGSRFEPVDFESNGLLWLPPEPEDEEDEREAVPYEDDDDDEGATGEWGYLRPSNSFGSGEYRSRVKSIEEHRRAMKNVVEGHFRALVAQLLQVENLPVSDGDNDEGWLDIITSLSWEAAGLLKPDTSMSGGMDPGGYVKVKCIASGHRSESVVVKGVVCKKNVAHRRMMSKIDKPRFLILGGALEYQRVSNLLSSVDTLLQQETDHLKMAVAKIAAHHPDVLLVEKSVSRYAQEYLLAKDISLVLNIKRPLLERIARCTGAQIVPSIDHLTSPKLGHCDMFHVDKLLEEHGSAGQGGKKLTKTLMFFEGCPKPLGCTILLKGANGDELKKVKHVVQYGIFAAYHLALETSFLADEGATLPELPLKSPITVALPDKPSSIDRSISSIPGFNLYGAGKPSGSQSGSALLTSDKGSSEMQKSNEVSDVALSTSRLEDANSTCLTQGPSSYDAHSEHALRLIRPAGSVTLYPSGEDVSNASHDIPSSNVVTENDNEVDPTASFPGEIIDSKRSGFDGNSYLTSFGSSEVLGQGITRSTTPELSSVKQDGRDQNEDLGSSKEEFPPSPSDHQSILVSLSTRCVWKGTVCEKAHLFRIKYYGNFDKPLGRFLRDHLFDQNYRCHSCEMPSEAHVYCYTHRQGSLTISVKKLQEFLLPGEREGKIWMWHRCLRCPRTNGFPPATRRVVMSDAAWGLSFGKFLELSFSNHAAASRVASCGHSLHRDCLRFYGFGRMVACFRYASIDVHSVFLPPPKVEFNYHNQEWIQGESKEVSHRAQLLFSEVYDALDRISKKMLGGGLKETDVKPPEASRICFLELRGMLQKEKEEFEEALQKIPREAKVGQPAVDVLEINKLQRVLLILSYIWDQRLIYAVNLSNNSLREGHRTVVANLKDRRVISTEKLVEMDDSSYPVKSLDSCDSFLLDTKLDRDVNQGGNGNQLGSVDKGQDISLDPNVRNETGISLSASENINETTMTLESGTVVRKVRSEGGFPVSANLSDTADAACKVASYPFSTMPDKNSSSLPDSSLVTTARKSSEAKMVAVNEGGNEFEPTLSQELAAKGPCKVESFTSGMDIHIPYANLHCSLSSILSLNAQKLGLSEYTPVYISQLREFEQQSGARLLLPLGINDTVIPVYDDEPTSIIAHALVSTDYVKQMTELEKLRSSGELGASFPPSESVNLLSHNSFDDSASDVYRSLATAEESILSLSASLGSLNLDPFLSTKDLHARVSFTDDGPLGKVKYSVTCYFAKRFEALRRICCPSDLDFVRSLSRCKKWGAQGGKSNVFFAKTLDDRFIIKQVTKTELESFMEFGPAYFKYLSESISTGSPTCLAKILGIYQVSSKHIKGGKETKMDVLVMENLLFRRNVTRLYDLKGSSRSRYNADTSGNNKVLLDQNLIEAMPTSPIFVGNKAKRLLERAVWNDTSFLASIDVMDYSLLVGVDEERHELVLGIIDFMRQYTWDKHLETWVKTSGILGGSKNTTPTVISPQQYKKRFRKAMTAYFLMVPDQWSPKIIPSASQSDLNEEHLQGVASVD